MKALREFFWDNERWRILVSVFVGTGVMTFATPSPPDALDGDFLKWFLATALIGTWVTTAFSVITVMVKPIKKMSAAGWRGGYWRGSIAGRGMLTV